MIYAYINYPRPHITIHRHTACATVMLHTEAEREIVKVNRSTIAHEVRKFADGEYSFAATGDLEELWLLVSLDTREQEIGVVYVIQALLGLRYAPLGDAPVTVHCGGAVEVGSPY